MHEGLREVYGATRQRGAVDGETPTERRKKVRGYKPQTTTHNQEKMRVGDERGDKRAKAKESEITG